MRSQRSRSRSARGRATSTCSRRPRRCRRRASAIDADERARLRPTSRGATRPGGRRTSRGARLREVVNPIAPAAQRVVELARHQREVVVGRGLVERALAHRPRAQRRVPDVGRVVDRLRQPVDGVEVLGERLPAPLDAGRERARVDVLGALEVAHHERARVVRRTGASVKPQLPITTVVTPCQHELAPCAVPEHLRVHVGVAVDEARGDDVALGVDLAGAPLPDPADAARCGRRRCRRRPGRSRSPEPSTTVPPRITRSKRTRHLRLPTRLPASHNCSSFWPCLQN